MSVYGYVRKDPDASESFDIDWSNRLRDGDYITASVWTVGVGLAQPQADEYEDTFTTVWLSGGVAGTRYTVSNRITTYDGETLDRTLIVECVDE